MGKDKVKIVVIGQVDSGKSTITSKLKAEQQRGIITDIALGKFETTEYRFAGTDAPGHCDFIRNMLTVTLQADCLLLILDSTFGGFETGIPKDGQTRELASLAFALGVKTIICCCNKMDATTPKYSEGRYYEIVKSISSILRKVGNIREANISGLEGENLIERSTNLDWYKGPTLLEALHQIHEPNRHSDKPLRLPLEDVNIGRNGTVAYGRIETGILKPGMKVKFGPVGVIDKVKSVQMNDESVQEALPGDYVSFHLNKKIDLKCGYVASNSKDDPAKQAVSFTSQLTMLNRPVARLNVICKGDIEILDCPTYHGPVKFEEIMCKVDWDENQEEVEKEPNFLEKGDVGIVKMVPTEPRVAKAFPEYPPLGRFTISDREKNIIGVGIIKSVEKKEYGDGGNKGIKHAVIKTMKRLGAVVGSALFGAVVQLVIGASS
ncbi:hypothetical protein FEM48_Zijuj07G0064800 [Ziziphus jujuba var. spinosa]|uniref:Tr-type G domain-containing protein n=1 Tax=Ziziphus jujuba var. spinosa TaxID=714518 RepID=A0A978V309_ZIZJJ|nr:hypothetical protein FEM48_Zijuj07G0064800 [Ziziphus jujuba var. spinosa]